MPFARLLAAAALAAPACAPHAARAPALPAVSLRASDGSPHDVAPGAPASVLVFFSAHCPCQAAHDARLVAFYNHYADRGVRLYVVDAEVGATAERDRAEAQRRGYPFPILLDPGGRLADAMGAEFATYVVVVDAAGRVTYRGGIDTDRSHLTPTATSFLTDAVEATLAGREPAVRESEALGCALQRR